MSQYRRISHSLEFSKRNTGGAGTGKDFAMKLSDALINFSKRSDLPPKHFEQIEIFTPGIGKDKISDATGNLIKKELVFYTRDVCKKLSINDGDLAWCTVENYDFLFEYNEWDDQGFYLPLNPFNNKPILLVPKAFLREIPSIGSEQLYRFIKSKENEQLRAKLNSDLHDELEKYELEEEEEKNGSSSIKRYVLNYIEQHHEILDEFINDVESHPNLYTQYNLEKDSRNIIKLPRLVKEFVDKNPLPKSAYDSSQEFHKFLNSLILRLKQFVEDKDSSGYKQLWEMKSVENNVEGNSTQHCLKFRNQASVKHLVEELVGEYCYKYKITLKEESGLGKNPVEFKHSKHKEKALLLAKTINNVSFKQDCLKKLNSELKRGKVGFCYYLVFVHASENLEELKKSIQELEDFDFKDVVFHLIIINSAQERDLDSSSLECRYMTTEREVCISYAHDDIHDGISSKVVDKLCEVLKGRNIDIIRDSEELKYKDSLTSFMQRLGRGKCVVTVISDKYLRSRYCMFELTELVRNGNFQERFVPLVLKDAKIYETVDIIEYVKLWEEKLDEMDKAMKSVKLANLAPNIREDIDIYSRITETISGFIGHLRDLIIPPIDIHMNSNFEEVANEIEKILSK